MPDDPHIPESLQQRLREAYRPLPPGLTPDIDARMLALARTLPRRSRTLRRLSLAAAILLACGTTTFVLTRPQSRSASPQAIAQSAARLNPSDLNGDGRIDMLDALALAQQVQSNTATLDLNHDGRIDAADADALATDAVSLERGTL